jgi:3-oxoacyl-[acyl-carrier protein] reductase
VRELAEYAPLFRPKSYVTGAATVVDGGLSLTNWFDPPDLGDL